MFTIIFKKSNGNILSIQNSNSSLSITDKMAFSMFPNHPDVGVWTTNKPVSFKDRIIQTEYGLDIYNPNKQHEQNKKYNSIQYTGSFYDAGGYANMNREILLRLNNMGYNIKSNPLSTPVQIENLVKSQIDDYKKYNFEPDRGIHIIGFTPMAIKEGKYRIAYTMMETESLHGEFVNKCNNFHEEIWTPSEWNKNIFINHGIKRPIHVIPLGIDISIYNELAKPKNVMCDVLPKEIKSNKYKSFMFMSLFGWSYRKGYDVLLQSFLEEFTDDEDVGMLIVSRYIGSSDIKHKKYVIEEILKTYKQVEDKTNRKSAHVHYFGDIIPIKMVPSVYASAHCFVNTSRGEGWHLPTLEAASIGLPVISTYNSAMTDYLNDNNSYLIRTDKLVKSDKRTSWISDYYRNQMFPQLGRKAIEECKKHMRQVFSNYKEAKEKSEILKRDVFTKYTWDICAHRVASRINEIE